MTSFEQVPFFKFLIDDLSINSALQYEIINLESAKTWTLMRTTEALS